MSRIINQTQAATKALQSGVLTHGVAPAGSTAQVTGAFPRKGFSQESSRDEMMRMKTQMIADYGGAQTPFGLVTASDADFQRLQQLRESEQLANMDAWVGQNFHTNDVTTRKWLQEVYPQYYDAREREMIDRAKMALRINLLLLRGPKNEKDLILQWGLATGQIQLDRNWNIIGAHLPAGQAPVPNEEQGRFAKGLFSPKRYLLDSERQRSILNPTNPFRPLAGQSAEVQTAQAQFPFPFTFGAPVTSRPYPNFLRGAVPYM